jgi:hypothetical protein
LDWLSVDADLPSYALAAPVALNGKRKVQVCCLPAETARKRKGAPFRDQPLFVDAKAGHIGLALYPAQLWEIHLTPHVHVERSLKPGGALGELVETPDARFIGTQAGDRACWDA